MTTIFDTETCGLHGPTVLIQYATDSDDYKQIVLHEVWNETILDTLLLIESFCNDKGGVVGFNLAFDWFHLCQTYTTLQLLADRVGFDEKPIHHIEAYADVEDVARNGPCLKPVTALDLMLHARKGPYQSTMDRKDIRIRRVPAILANPLANELENRIKLKDIYFARRKDVLRRKWEVYPIKNSEGQINPDFKDVVLKFSPSAALKKLAADALGLPPDTVLLFADIDVDRKWRPLEAGWAPFAKAIAKSSSGWLVRKSTAKTMGETAIKKNGYAWPAVIVHHVDHWAYNKLARQYAAKDVELTRDLWHHFKEIDDNCEMGDNDSILACMVGAVRWRGYSIDIEGIKELRKDAKIKSEAAPKAPRFVYKYVSEMMSDMEKDVIKGSTKRVILETIEKWVETCPKCGCDEVKYEKRDDPSTVYCAECSNKIGMRHPAAVRAGECLYARKAQKEIEMYDKLLQAGRFHVSMKVIGTLSSRMAGADGLNPQGIKHDKHVRNKFILSWGDLELCGGDFSGFEISIADAVYNDENLRRELCTCHNCNYICTTDEFRGEKCPGCQRVLDKCLRKIHGLFGMELNPGLSYDEILKTKGLAVDLYDMGKRGVFSQLYGGNFQTLMTKLGVTEEVARRAEQGFAAKYAGVGRARQMIDDKFCSMKQPKGIGTKVEWHDPAEYIESLTGFRRYFTIENMICKALFVLANKPPLGWKEMPIRVTRRDREQKVGGAAMSALYGAAFQIQAAAMRAAANHVIQSSGATITKELQCRIWKLQPSGVQKWHVQPMNVHDEIMSPCLPHLKVKIKEVVDGIIDDYKGLVPLIKIDWNTDMKNWAEK